MQPFTSITHLLESGHVILFHLHYGVAAAAFKQNCWSCLFNSMQLLLLKSELSRRWSQLSSWTLRSSCGFLGANSQGSHRSNMVSRETASLMTRLPPTCSRVEWFRAIILWVRRSWLILKMRWKKMFLENYSKPYRPSRSRNPSLFHRQVCSQIANKSNNILIPTLMIGVFFACMPSWQYMGILLEPVIG